MKPGRNDPCPCGSGKKYKHCCLNPAGNTVSDPDELLWRRMRALLDAHTGKMVRFIDDRYGLAGLYEAWDDFTGYSGVEMDIEAPLMQLFMPWYFNCWSPDPVETEVKDKSLHNVIPVAAYLAARGRHMDPLLRRYLESLLAEPFTFYEVIASESGAHMTLRDVMSREERVVTERAASSDARRGDMLFGQLASVDHLFMLEAGGPLVISPMEKARILDLRNFIAAGNPQITRDVLRGYDTELIELFHEITDRAENPVMPQMQNTDGEVLSPRKLVFDLKVPPAAAYNALKHLCVVETEEEIMAEAARDAAGELKRVTFSWGKSGNAMHAAWDNTRMGVIDINGTRLTADVNSEARADALRRHVETALGEDVHFRACQIQSVEKMLGEARLARESGAFAADSESERLAEQPEVREQIARMIEAHWERWVDQPIPMLGDKTPREAVRDDDGREIVESLIIEGERLGRNMKPPTGEAVFRRLRERLGLA